MIIGTHDLSLQGSVLKPQSLSMQKEVLHSIEVPKNLCFSFWKEIRGCELHATVFQKLDCSTCYDDMWRNPDIILFSNLWWVRNFQLQYWIFIFEESCNEKRVRRREIFYWWLSGVSPTTRWNIATTRLKVFVKQRSCNK